MPKIAPFFLYLHNKFALELQDAQLSVILSIQGRNFVLIFRFYLLFLNVNSQAKCWFPSQEP